MHSVLKQRSKLAFEIKSVKTSKPFLKGAIKVSVLLIGVKCRRGEMVPGLNVVGVKRRGVKTYWGETSLGLNVV